MGVKVSYRATRGSHEVGAEISDPVEFFTEVFDDDAFEMYQTAFQGLPADKQQEFLAVFDGAVEDMDMNVPGNLWLDEAKSDVAALTEKMNKIKEIMASCQ